MQGIFGILFQLILCGSGKRISCGSNFRYGHRRGPEGTNLIVWIKKESIKPAGNSLYPLND